MKIKSEMLSLVDRLVGMYPGKYVSLSLELMAHTYKGEVVISERQTLYVKDKGQLTHTATLPGMIAVVDSLEIDMEPEPEEEDEPEKIREEEERGFAADRAEFARKKKEQDEAQAQAENQSRGAVPFWNGQEARGLIDHNEAQEKIECVEPESAELKRYGAVKPDKEKLLEFADQMREFSDFALKLNNREARNLLAGVIEDLIELEEIFRGQIELL